MSSCQIARLILFCIKRRVKFDLKLPAGVGWPLEGVGVKTISWAAVNISLKINLNSLSPLLFLIVYMPVLVRSYPTHEEYFSFPGQFFGCMLAWGILVCIYGDNLLILGYWVLLTPEKWAQTKFEIQDLERSAPLQWLGTCGVVGGWLGLGCRSSRESAGRGGYDCAPSICLRNRDAEIQFKNFW